MCANSLTTLISEKSQEIRGNLLAAAGNFFFQWHLGRRLGTTDVQEWDGYGEKVLKIDLNMSLAGMAGPKGLLNGYMADERRHTSPGASSAHVVNLHRMRREAAGSSFGSLD